MNDAEAAGRTPVVLGPGENRGNVRAGILNFSMPGDFEPAMPGIAQWFAENPPRDTGSP